MTKIASVLMAAAEWLKRRDLTFGLREAIVISLVGIAIASIAAYHYVNQPVGGS